MKLGRQSIIMEIISERDIETQNQLLEALAERGVKSTQATLSRDIRDMRLVKELGPKGNYRYVAAAKQETPDLDQSIFNSLHSVCLDTMPGWESEGEKHSFLDRYDRVKQGSEPVSE